MEGFDISCSESRGTSGGLKDFHGDSSSVDKSGEKIDIPSFHLSSIILQKEDYSMPLVLGHLIVLATLLKTLSIGYAVHYQLIKGLVDM